MPSCFYRTTKKLQAIGHYLINPISYNYINHANFQQPPINFHTSPKLKVLKSTNNKTINQRKYTSYSKWLKKRSIQYNGINFQIQIYVKIYQLYSNHLFIFKVVKINDLGHKIFHSNINIYSLTYQRQNSQIKLFYHKNMPSSIDLYYQDKQWSYLYLSPQQMEWINHKKDYDKILSSVFNLGCLLLSLIVQSRQGYGNSQILKQKLCILKKKYDLNICNFFQKMIRLNAQERLNFFQLQLEMESIIKQLKKEGTEELKDLTHSKSEEQTGFKGKRRKHRIFQNKNTKIEANQECMMHCFLKC